MAGGGAPRSAAASNNARALVCGPIPSTPLCGAEDATRQRPGMSAMGQHDLPADDDVIHAVRALHPPGHPGAAVVRDLVLLHPDAREVEDHEGGRPALPHPTAVTETHEACT